MPNIQTLSNFMGFIGLLTSDPSKSTPEKLPLSGAGSSEIIIEHNTFIQRRNTYNSAKQGKKIPDLLNPQHAEKDINNKIDFFNKDKRVPFSPLQATLPLKLLLNIRKKRRICHNLTIWPRWYKLMYNIEMIYPLKFRQHVLAFKKKEALTYAETADRFGVGSASLMRWAQRMGVSNRLDCQLLRL